MGDPTTTRVDRAATDRSIATPEERTRRDALVRNIATRLMLCSLDEARVMDELLVRLEIGRDRYGYLDLATARDWEREEAEELLDAAIYRACRKLLKRDADVAEIEKRHGGEG